MFRLVQTLDQQNSQLLAHLKLASLAEWEHGIAGAVLPYVRELCLLDDVGVTLNVNLGVLPQQCHQLCLAAQRECQKCWPGNVKQGYNLSTPTEKYVATIENGGESGDNVSHAVISPHCCVLVQFLVLGRKTLLQEASAR